MEKPKDSSVLSANNHWLNSLPFKLSVIQFAVAIVIIATSMWLIFSIETKHHMETEQTLSQSKGQAIVALAQEDVAKIESLALAVGSIGETYQKRSIEIANLVPPMLDINHYHNLIVGGGVWPEPGAFNENKQQDSYFWTRSDDQQFVRVYSYNDDGKRYQDEPWYKPTRFIPHGSAYWSPAYTDPHTKEIMVTASAPMWRDHEFIGVSTVDIRLEAINKFLIVQILPLMPVAMCLCLIVLISYCHTHLIPNPAANQVPHLLLMRFWHNLLPVMPQLSHKWNLLMKPLR